jgi:hypothetical protein
MWNSIASRIIVSIRLRVFPVATQPGRSGTYADQFRVPGS